MKLNKYQNFFPAAVIVCAFAISGLGGSRALALTTQSLWSQQFAIAGSSNYPFQAGKDSAGNLYIVGNSTGSGSPGYLIKYDQNGNQLWATKFGNIVYGANLVVTPSGDSYVAAIDKASTMNDFLVLKFDGSGSQVWSNRYDGSIHRDDGPGGIALDVAGNVYVTGYSYVSSSRADATTIRYDSNGNQQWVRQYSNGVDDRGVGIKIGSTGDPVVLTTSFNSSNLDFATIKYEGNGNQSWVSRYDSGDNDHATSLAVDNSQDVYVTGYSDVYNAQNVRYQNLVTLKYNNNGSQLWASNYITNGLGTANAVKVDGSGNVYIVGTNNTGGYSSIAIKYGTNGSQLWAKTQQAQGTALDLDGSGNVYVGGTGYPDGNPADAEEVVQKYDNSGNLLWTHSVNNATFGDMVTDGNGGAYVTGQSCPSGGSANCVIITSRLIELLDAPQSLTAPSPTRQHPQLSWAGVSGADYYNVYRNGSLLDTIDSSNTTYTDSSVADGTYTYYVTALNSVDESNASNAVGVLYDTVPLAITYMLSPVPNANGWNNSAVTITFTCTDPTSGATITSCSLPATISTEGVNQTTTGTAIDGAGNQSAVTVTVNLDKTAPTANGAAMSNTFIIIQSNENISANASDTLSGIQRGEYYIDTDPGQGNGHAMTYGNGKVTATATIGNGLGTGNHTLYIRVQDKAGNWSTVATRTFTVLL